MILLRKILFYFFLVLYLVLCPMIILYAFGYIFAPKAEEGFVKTGLIHLGTLPEYASISIGNRRYVEKTPATIRNLLAGSYDVKVSLKGYRPWMRKVTVESGKAVHFDKVLLLPQPLKVRQLLSRSLESMTPVPGTRFLILKATDRMGDLRVFDWKNETVRPLLPEGSSLVDAKLGRIFSAKESTFVLILAKTVQGERFLGFQLDKEKPQIKDYSALFIQGEPKEILWEGDRPDFLFAFYGNRLDRVSLEKRIVTQAFLEKVQGLGLSHGKVYALRSSAIVRLGLNGKKGEEREVEQGTFLENLFGSSQYFKMDFISGSTVCFYGERGEFLANMLPYRFVREGLQGYRTDDSGRRIVLWLKEKVGVLDFEKPERKKELFDRGPEIEWVFEKGTDIRDAYFVYGSACILFRDGKDVFLSRLGEGNASLEKLVSVKENSTVFYSEKTGKLYYLEPAHGFLMAAEILPAGMTISGVFNELEKETEGVMK